MSVVVFDLYFEQNNKIVNKYTHERALYYNKIYPKCSLTEIDQNLIMGITHPINHEKTFEIPHHTTYLDENLYKVRKQFS